MHKQDYSLALAGAIIGRSGRILLVKQSNGHWNHPCGFVNTGENPLATAKRSVQAATGYVFEPSGLLGVYSLDTGEHVQQVKIVYKGKLAHVKGSPEDDTPMESRWFSPKEIYGLGNDELAAKDIKTMVRDYFAGRGGDIDLVKHSAA